MIDRMKDEGTREVQVENGAVRENTDNKTRPDLMSPFALERLGHWYRMGAKKYGDRNWEKGMNYSRYTQSMFRHLLQWMKGDTSEDHLSAIAWNAMAIMHHQELKETHLDDMIKYMDGERYE